jgi:hypothetical protein
VVRDELGDGTHTLYTQIIPMDPNQLEVRFDTAGTAADLGMEWALEGTVHGSSAAFQTAKIGDVYELIYGEPMPSPDENDEDEDDEGEV